MFRFVFLRRCARHTGKSGRKKILNAVVLTGALALSGCSASREELFECGPAENTEALAGAESADESEKEPAAAVTVDPDPPEASEPSGLPEETLPETPEPVQDEPMYIDVRGAVVRPGVYPLPPGSRIWQAVEAAGGAAEDAAVSYLNQAALLEDGQQIYVPALQEIRSGETLPSASGGMVSDRSGWYMPGGSGSADGADPGAETGNSALADGGAGGTPEGSLPDGKVDLNTADVSRLMTLSGIGQVRAEAIVQYRDQAGGFGSIEEIMKVPGIKQGTFEKIRDKIFVSGR